MERKSIPLTFFLLLTVIILVPTFVLAINSLMEGYKLLPQTTITINAWKDCKRVTNASRNVTYFVPTASAPEWAAFQAHLPPDVSTSACGGCTPDCAGKECGDDGCGGSCGTCTNWPETCNGGTYQCDCLETCGGLPYYHCGTVGACDCGGCTAGNFCCQPSPNYAGLCKPDSYNCPPLQQ